MLEGMKKNHILLNAGPLIYPPSKSIFFFAKKEREKIELVARPVYFLVVPDGDGDSVVGSHHQVEVGVPLGVNCVLGRFGRVHLKGVKLDWLNIVFLLVKAGDSFQGGVVKGKRKNP